MTTINPHQQRSNGTFGPGAITGIRPQKLDVLDRNQLPEGASIYPFIISFDEEAVTDTLTLGDGTVVNGCACVFDMRSIQQVQKLSALRSMVLNLTSGNGDPSPPDYAPALGDWFIQTDQGQLFQFSVAEQLDPAVAGTSEAVLQPLVINGVINLVSIAPSKILIFKAEDATSGVGTGPVNGVANLIFTNYEIQPWLTQMPDNTVG